ncbi:hypothetical protein [Clostridium taeniosporum]|uniref:Uncharacterized protein n=1 Tax=Clostridium taeniosporum TaxID=394958 RepID=A0A1D7XP88_9CLOT|nr:hypothetical protein [Clostridium taeniosporum]AOR25010.1 hypothetical protein BGI42_14785 [Clostridium taeniosporum]
MDQRVDEKILDFINEAEKREAKNHVRTLKIEALNKTSLIDIRKTNGSFQNFNITYGDIFNPKNSKYSDVAIEDNVTDKTKIGNTLFQYKETDWNFLKRIASDLNSELYYDIINLNNMFYFGILHEHSYELKANMDYESFKDKTYAPF